MYEDENLDEKLNEQEEEGSDDESENLEDEGLEDEEGTEEYEEGGSSGPSLSDRIRNARSRNTENEDEDLKEDIDNAKDKKEEQPKEQDDNQDNKKNNEENKKDDLDKKDNNDQNKKGKNETPKGTDKKNDSLLGDEQNRPKQQNKRNKLNSNDAASEDIKNKLNDAKNKAKQNNPASTPSNIKTPKTTSNAGGVGKEGLKEGAKKGAHAAAEGAKKGAQAAAKGIAQVLSKLPPQAWAVIGVIILVILFITLLIVFVGAIDGDSGSGVTYDPTSTDKTEFMCTMVNPLTGKIGPEGSSLTSLFGYRNLDGKTDFHEAVDLIATSPESEDIPVYAVHAGTATTTWYGTGGNTVIIEHANGFKSYYLHLKSWTITSGVEVKQGDIIGYEGNTGGKYQIHLDLRIRDDANQWFSLNPYFGINDSGYENCLIDGSGESADKCGYNKATGAINTDRVNNTINFQEDVCSKYNFEDGTNTSTDIFQFIANFEGGITCTTSSGVEGYKVVDIRDGTLTLGRGFTNHVIGVQRYTDIINNSGYTNLFEKNGSHYKLIKDACIPQTLANELVGVEIATVKERVKTFAKNNEVTLQEHQIDALTSFSYQNGNGVLDNGITPLDSLLRAYKNYNDTSYTEGKTCANIYEGLWSKMGLYFNPGSDYEEGLKKRRKAEFALFVTGDYTDQGLFTSRTIDDDTYSNYDSEGVMAREKK